MHVVLSIAGSDSGGGAGIQADLKTFEAHGVFGVTAITSITAQNTTGVLAIADLPIDIVRAQLDAVFDDFDVAAVKIGMLSHRAIIETVASFLRERAVSVPIVLDPVMVATSGDRLLRDEAIAALTELLAPLAALITPNAGEAAVLSGRAVETLDDMLQAAQAIRASGSRAVLVKGGHVAAPSEHGTPQSVDLLLDHAGPAYFTTPRIETVHTHGTGCTLSSAIAANLASGLGMHDAVRRAKSYVFQAIANAPGLGSGHGPLLHRWRQAQQEREREQ